MIPAHIPLQEEGLIGSDVERTRLRLLDVCDELEVTGDSDLKDRIAPIRDRLTNFVARVAIIGQMKSGKSTLTNSLTRRSSLLPSDINPWTSVVTRLHFGHPSGQTSGARFSFFDEGQWDRLATRGGKLGELTEGLLEDYKRNELFSQVTAMQKRARQRLGDSYEKLLGKSHRFETVTHEVIERYVCAGDEVEERLQRPAAGRYNDITHAADIFFARDPFGCAVSVLDTPGTNDPLLIREEITHQNLETADYFVVVLSAHQALTDTDLQLVRVLRALKRDRIIAFVNRIDEVNNLVADFEALRDQVARRISSELGGAQVPVILGSAEWAGKTLFGGEGRVDDRLVAEISALKRKHPRSQSVAGRLGVGPSADRLLASGVAELEAALSKHISDGAANTLFNSAIDDLSALARQVAGLATFRLGPVKAEKAARALPSPAELKSTVDRVTTRVKSLQDKVHQLSKTAWSDARTDMANLIEGATDDLETQLAGVKSGPEQNVEIDKLRDDLKTRFDAAFSQVLDITWEALRSVNKTHLEIFTENVTDAILNVKARTLGVLEIEPDTEKLHRPLTLDVAGNWLSGLFLRANSRIKTAVALAKGQLSENCDALLASGSKALHEEFDAAIGSYLGDLQRVTTALSKAQGSDSATSARQADIELRAAKSALKLLEGLRVGLTPTASATDA